MKIKYFLLGSVLVSTVITLGVLRWQAPISASNPPSAKSNAESLLEGSLEPAPTLAESNGAVVHPIDVPDRILGILEGPFPTRLHNSRNVSSRLSEEEVQSLYQFLRSRNGDNPKSRGGEHVLKNNVMDILLQQNPPLPDLAENLIDLSKDALQDDVTRDYALQHLISLCEQQPELVSKETSEIVSTLWDALSKKESSIAGSALLGLHRLESQLIVDPSMISERALELAERGDLLVRITALQVCAQRGLASARPLVLEIAKSSEDLTLQISAIAALGELGTTEEIHFLEELASGDNQAIKSAVSTAIRKLSSRYAQGTSRS